MSHDEQHTLQTLQAEIDALKTRVAALENKAESLPSASQPAAASSESRSNLRKLRAPNKTYQPDPGASTLARPTASADHSNLEEYIGGRILNWIGALIVVFAVAYFLKWSFDNQIIGEMGRCIMGLISGITMMTAGQICHKRGYHLYAQGLFGAGIAIIYLSSFAAVNYYHLITPYVAFTLMFITAITGGILSALDNAPATAIMATIGGFLVPFLMGSHTGQVIPLLSYVLILDLGVLFLAYYRQWLALDILALIGTLIISGVAQTMNWQVWSGQAFLTVYLVLFIAVAANYDHRTRNHNQLLLFFTTVFFSTISFGNVIERIEDWRGLFTLALAGVFLIIYFLPVIAKNTTIHFRKWLLIWAMFFALLTAPLHLNDVYSAIAWLAVAAALLYMSRHFYKQALFIAALAIIAAVFATTMGSYVRPNMIPVLNQATGLLLLCTVDWLLALAVSTRLFTGRIYLPLTLSAVVISTLFYLAQFDISNAIYFYQINQSYTFLVPVTWAVISTLVLVIGVRRHSKATRLLSLVLYGVVIIRTLFFDLRQLDIVYKILVLLAIGLIALAISFFYQKRMKGDVLP